MGAGGADSDLGVSAVVTDSGRAPTWSDWLASRLIRSRASSSELVAREVGVGVFKFGAFMAGDCEIVEEAFEMEVKQGYQLCREAVERAVQLDKHRIELARSLVKSSGKSGGCEDRSVRIRTF